MIVINHETVFVLALVFPCSGNGFPFANSAQKVLLFCKGMELIKRQSILSKPSL